MTARRLTPFVLVALVVAAFGAAVLADAPAQRGDDWSPVIYPAQDVPLTFSHAKHLARGASCAMCHAGATTSRSAVDNLLPTEAACRACHPIDRSEPERVVPGAPPAQCRACHPGWTPDAPVPRVAMSPPPLKFDHAAHVSTPCARCHGDLTKVDLATRRHLPTMASCVSCHKTGATPRGCAECHLTRIGGLLDTDLAHGPLVPRHTGFGDAHGPGFERDHRQEAQQLGATCTACHDQSECLACHVGVTKPLEFHPANYALVHAVDAKRGKPDCSACHRAQSFCVACHERSGVGTRVPSEYDQDDPARQFHPPNWVSAMGGANQHAREARRNITACASCHREEDCLQCHSAEPMSLRVSPHPKGWRGSARCRALDSGNRRMCLRCHITREELGCDWSAP